MVVGRVALEVVRGMKNNIINNSNNNYLQPKSKCNHNSNIIIMKLKIYNNIHQHKKHKIHSNNNLLTQLFCHKNGFFIFFLYLNL